MLQIIHNDKGFQVVNITLGSYIATYQTEEEAETLKSHILNN